MWSDGIDILMILASENIQTLAKLGHETLFIIGNARWLYGVPDGGGGCLYQLRFGSPRSALDFRGNMSEKINKINITLQSSLSL